ncbi:MAG TPA: capsular biosynthesis protein, partial [Bryobacteraceae bacterium]|nr:capsular biosynthesis protein [Bryobacteraceae bacterium]
MSRVHDALRRAEVSSSAPVQPPVLETPGQVSAVTPVVPTGSILDNIKEIPFHPAPEAHLLNTTQPHEPPSEEFRTLRTKLNHIQTLQPIHSVVVTSPSPAEGKSFAAANLALAESHLEGNRTLLADFD